MTETHAHKNQVTPLGAGLTGATIGAIVGVGMALFFSNPKNREKLGKSMKDMQTWGNETLGNLKKRTHDMSDETLQAVQDATEKSSDAVEKLRKDSPPTVQK